MTGIFRNSVIGRKRLLWIIVGISTVVIIAVVVIPMTIILKRKGSELTTTNTTMEIRNETATTMYMETTEEKSTKAGSTTGQSV